MYDFCLSPLYAAALGLGGVAGYASKGSTASLAGGLGSAAVLAVCTYASLRAHKEGRLCRPATFVSFCLSAALAAVMWGRWQRTGKVMPAGAVAVLSVSMAAFYAWNLLLFRPNFAAKRH